MMRHEVGAGHLQSIAVGWAIQLHVATVSKCGVETMGVLKQPMKMP